MGILLIDRYANMPENISAILDNSMFNGVSDLINLNRRHSGVRMTVTLSTAQDPPHRTALCHTNGLTLSTSLLYPRPCAHPVCDDVADGQDAGSDGRKLIFLS